MCNHKYARIITLNIWLFRYTRCGWFYVTYSTLTIHLNCRFPNKEWHNCYFFWMKQLIGVAFGKGASSTTFSRSTGIKIYTSTHMCDIWILCGKLRQVTGPKAHTEEGWMAQSVLMFHNTHLLSTRMCDKFRQDRITDRKIFGKFHLSGSSHFKIFLAPWKDIVQILRQWPRD